MSCCGAERTQNLVSSMTAKIQRPALTSHLVVHRFDRVLSLRSLLNPVADASVQRVHGKTDQTYKPRSAKTQAAKSHYKWKSMKVQCRARTETEGRGKIVQFASKEDMIQFLTAHQQTCSTTILDKCLASPDRTATEDWS